VKRRKLLQEMETLGAVFVREGGAHSLYRNPRTGRIIAVPRHAEINELTARSILREARE
jgi:predicted RNA binding protein YcfA (HicA-like mRNA interferase family)